MILLLAPLVGVVNGVGFEVLNDPAWPRRSLGPLFIVIYGIGDTCPKTCLFFSISI